VEERTPNVLHYDSFDDASWSLPITAAWIIWRSRAGAAAVIATILKRERHLQIFDVFQEAARSSSVSGEPPEGGILSFQQAQAQLWDCLKDGRLAALGIRVSEAVWSQIAPEEWSELDYQFCGDARPSAIGCCGVERYYSVTVPRCAVLNLWPVASVAHRAPRVGIKERKRKALDDAIKAIGIDRLDKMRGKARESTLMTYVKEQFGLTISDRFVRDRFKEQQYN
jgi:hypothetical protein